MRLNLFKLTCFLLLPVAYFLATGYFRESSNGKVSSMTGVAYAATAGANNCASGANDTSTGSVAWSNPGNACSTGASTTAAGLKSSILSNHLKITQFGFSVPTGSVIQGISFSVTRSTTVNKGNKATDNSVRIVKGGSIGSTDRSDANNWGTASVTYGSTSDLWGDSWTAADINSTGFGIAISGKGTGANSVDGTISSYVTATVTYQAPPNSPSQNLPSNGATGVSITPTFTMTSTDPEVDALNYKVEIYSNSGCTTVVQTNDQSASQTGWTGTDTTCGSPSRNCYSSGTSGSFLTQSALSGATQYWWKAFAKDPAGSDYYVGSSSCNSFTTTVPVSVVLTTSGLVSYGTISANSSKSTSEISQTQTVQNDSGSTENLNIKTSNATGGTTWTLGSAPGNNIFVFEFKATGDADYTKFSAPDSYQTLATGVTASSTKNVDLRITTPTTSSDYQQKTVTITVQAVAP